MADYYEAEVYSRSQSLNIIFVILNQDSIFHYQKALQLQGLLLEDAKINNIDINVIVLSEEYDDTAYWTFFPLPEKLLGKKNLGSWYVFIEEFCVIDLPKLNQFLIKKDHQKLIYLGRELHDESSTIIHHFDSINPENQLNYPDPRTGIIISLGLMIRVAQEWNSFNFTINFSIDASYEFSKFLLQIFGVKLSSAEGICIEKIQHCFVWTSPILKCSSKEGGYITSLENIHFAVKTCKMHSSDRLPLIKKTWLAQVSNFGIYSDKEDISEDRISLNVPNVERGHCGKTMEIIRHTAKLDRMEWLVIVDDDTLLSVKRLASLLQCYPSTSMLAIGERYGYKAPSGDGFDYLTGGAGMVLSRKLVNFLASSEVCHCPSNDTPDDMFLGACFKKHRIPVIHSRRFHQGRPDDYSYKLLKGTYPISFHKFWMINPRDVFETWLNYIENELSQSIPNHAEL